MIKYSVETLGIVIRSDNLQLHVIEMGKIGWCHTPQQLNFPVQGSVPKRCFGFPQDQRDQDQKKGEYFDDVAASTLRGDTIQLP